MWINEDLCEISVKITFLQFSNAIPGSINLFYIKKKVITLIFNPIHIKKCATSFHFFDFYVL